MRGRGGGFRVGNKSDFSSLGQDDMLCLLGTFIFFQLSPREDHYDLGSYFILEETDKKILEERIYHAFHSKRQVLKESKKIFDYSRLFQLG